MLDLEEILAIARPIAWGAAEILLEYYRSPQDLQIREKSVEDGDVTSADIAANDFILQRLHAAFGMQEFAYLSEETVDDRDRLRFERVWAIDPLDGTSDFIKRTGEFAIHIGLSDRQRSVLGLVACPVAAKLFTAIAGGGAFVEQRDGTRAPLRVSHKTDAAEGIAIASRSHRSAKLDFILNRLPKSQELSVGSIGGKLGAIAEAQADYYVSVSGKSAPKDWDYCAPEIVLTEAGGKLTHFDGSPLTYNNADVTQWGNILASNGTCHDQLRSLCEAAASAYEREISSEA